MAQGIQKIPGRGSLQYWKQRYETYELKALQCKYNLALQVERANALGQPVPEDVLSEDQQHALLDWKQLIDAIEPGTQVDVLQPAL